MNNKEPEFKKELESLLNKYSIDTELMTPDFILANHLVKYLYDFAEVIRLRGQWHDHPEFKILPSTIK